MDAPLVSVLVPVRDAAPTLAAALETVRRQTERDWECVVVDDGSRDDSAAIARGFAARDARFRVLEAPPRGIVAALNLGLEACRGAFVARHDGDDLMRRDRLLLQRAALERDPSLDAVGAHVRMFPRDDLTGGLRAYERWLATIDGPAAVRRERFVESPIVHPTLFARREAMQAFGYRDLGWPEDYDLVLRWLAAGREVGVVARRLVSWRDGPSRLSRTSAACQQDRIVACKARFLADDFLAGGDAYALWGYGDTGKQMRRALAACGKRAAYLVDVHPRRIGQRIDGADVVAPEAIARRERLPVVACVAGLGPRADLRARAAAEGLVEGRDFVCAA